MTRRRKVPPTPQNKLPAEIPPPAQTVIEFRQLLLQLEGTKTMASVHYVVNGKDLLVVLSEPQAGQLVQEVFNMSVPYFKPILSGV